MTGRVVLASLAVTAVTASFAVSAAVGGGVTWPLVSNATDAIALAVAAWLLAARVPGLAMALAVAGGGAAVSLALGAVADLAVRGGADSLAAAASWVASLLWPLWAVTLTTFAIALYPTGRVPDRRWRAIVPLGIAAVAGTMLAQAVSGAAVQVGTGPGVADSPVAASTAGAAVGAVAAAVWVVAGLGSLALVVVRWVRSRGVERAAMAYALLAAMLLVAFQAVGAEIPGVAGEMVTLLVPKLLLAALILGAAGVATRAAQRVADIVFQVAVLGTLAWATIALVGLALPAGTAADAGAALVIVVAVGLAHRRVAALAHRVAYGRADPYAELERLRAALANAASDSERRDAIRASVARAVGPAPVRVDAGGEGCGADPHDAPLEIPMIASGERLGTIRLGAVEGGASAADTRRLVAEMAAVAADSWRAAVLDRELAASRHHGAFAAADERRRLRADLHDGLGPHLAGARLRLEALRRGMADGDPLAPELAGVSASLTGVATEVRRLVDASGPDPLHGAGLAQALHAVATAFPEGAPRIVLACDARELPAAAEVAAYRIVVEALTNAVRHADASWCEVTVATEDGGLRVAVEDDGRGMPTGYVAGAGVPSMRRRAAELGGACRIDARPEGGTRVEAWLPMTEEVARA